MASPTSFRLRPETLRQLDRIAELLSDRARREGLREPGLQAPERVVTRAEALAAAVRDTQERLERELDAEPGSARYRAAADAGRGVLGVDAEVSLVDELLQARRAEAAAER
jgi:hypothetical protein